jgi:hemoglobin
MKGEAGMSIAIRSRAIFLAASICVSGAGVARAGDTLFQDMGGQEVLAKLANDTTDNFLADPRIKATFDNSNMDRFRQKLAEQFCQVAGGPCIYTGHSMRDAHRGLHLTNADFNAVVEDLQRAMDKNGISFATQNRFLARLAPMQRDVVTR